ncbi:hypothetical protein [Bacillus sp. 1P06AnD]|uniref:hypothetical protein n=1 Tax=Bacillus sp. 1P06AnD TaxID=3132208 RepID=UPI0039A2CD17
MATAKGHMLEAFIHDLYEGRFEEVSDRITEGIQWKLAGKTTIEGKNRFLEYAGKQDSTFIDWSISHTITHGITAAVNGTATMKDRNQKVKQILFCHIFLLGHFNKSPFRNGMNKAMPFFPFIFLIRR